jgi:hypothetical protein
LRDAGYVSPRCTVLNTAVQPIPFCAPLLFTYTSSYRLQVARRNVQNHEHHVVRFRRSVFCFTTNNAAITPHFLRHSYASRLKSLFNTQSVPGSPPRSRTEPRQLATIGKKERLASHASKIPGLLVTSHFTPQLPLLSRGAKSLLRTNPRVLESPVAVKLLRRKPE